MLDKKGVEDITARHGRPLFDRSDIERATQFHAILKQRFAKDLSTLEGNVT